MLFGFQELDIFMKVWNTEAKNSAGDVLYLIPFKTYNAFQSSLENTTEWPHGDRSRPKMFLNYLISQYPFVEDNLISRLSKFDRNRTNGLLIVTLERVSFTTEIKFAKAAPKKTLSFTNKQSQNTYINDPPINLRARFFTSPIVEIFRVISTLTLVLQTVHRITIFLHIL